MKITMDKSFTESNRVERTKAQMKEFKEMYTDVDLLRMFREAIGDSSLGFNYAILRCNLRAFPGGYSETDETHYNVEMLLEGFREFIKLTFYISQSGVLDVRPRWVCKEWMNMYEIRRYREV